MEFLISKIVPLLMTAAAILAMMGIAMAVGNISGKIIKKVLGIGGK